MLKKRPITVAMMAILAVLASPVAYAQTPDGETPANEAVCDVLIGATPGLYGLCVAFCEAQDCDAVFDPAAAPGEEVTFDPSCRPSSAKLLENYNKRANSGDLPMPCVNVVENECLCWTEEELDAVADGETFICGDNLPPLEVWELAGFDLTSDYFENVTADRFGEVFGGPACAYNALSPTPTIRVIELTPEQATRCVESVQAECGDRGF